jgi:hypothetical protein
MTAPEWAKSAAGATCHSSTGPSQHRWAPPWQNPIGSGPPQMPRGTHLFAHISSQVTKIGIHGRVSLVQDHTCYQPVPHGNPL